MGASDIVPGVSGGTIAFISGLYQRLIDAIASFDSHALHLLIRGRLGTFWRYIDGAFLVTLLVGIGISIVLLSSVMSRALAYHPAVVYSFFIGLIIASAAMIAKNITRRSWAIILAVVIGLAGGLLITQLSPGNVADPSWWMIMGAAAIAICAMILPGISWSFLLLLMGMYEVTINAVHERNIAYILLFAGGAALGLLTFVRVVRRAFTRYHDVTVGVLLGLMIGSLPLLFPRNATEAVIHMSDWWIRAVAFLIGIAAIIGINYARSHLSRYQDKSLEWTI